MDGRKVQILQGLPFILLTKLLKGLYWNMKIYNTETGDTVELTYAPNGWDCLSDLTASDNCIVYNEEEERYEADGSAIEWWEQWIEAQEETDKIIAALKEEIDPVEVWEVVNNSGCCDMEDEPHWIKDGLIELASENGLELKKFKDGSVGFFKK